MEEWKDIKGYEGRYMVSSLGRVRSLSRVITKSNGVKMTVKPRIIKQIKDNYGYFFVNLSKEGVVYTVKVHKLVALEFLDHKPNGSKIVIDHRDNNPLNNSAKNLQILTQRQNLSKDVRGTSKYVGVSFIKKRGKWQSTIQINGKNVNLGSFFNEKIASAAYQSKLEHILKTQ